MRTQRLCVGVLGLALALALAGCGGDDDAGAGGDGDLRARYIDAIAATEEDQSPVSGDEARCFAVATVDAIGVDDLSEALSPEEIEETGEFDPIAAGVEVSDEEAGTFYDGLSDCVDLRQMFLDSVAAGDEMSPDQVDCIDQAVDDELLREFVLSSLLEGDEGAGGADVMADLQGALLPCLEAETG